ncbi:MAG: hypothetical protein AAB267_08870, partial [Candidatus Desantisbacteria bacterium]
MKQVVVSLLAVILILGCDTISSASKPNIKQRNISALQCIKALQAGNMDEAERLSATVLSEDDENPYALLVKAIARYTMVALKVSWFVRTQLLEARSEESLRYLKDELEDAEKELVSIESDLDKINSLDQVNQISLNLCPACWKIDWNRDGEFDERDERLLSVDTDVDGKEISHDDPRRKPIIRFDRGDILWAQAYINNQLATLNIILAFHWGDILSIAENREQKQIIRIRLSESYRIKESRDYFLKGIALADKARQAYLAEKDDDCEWIPNPKQK